MGVRAAGVGLVMSRLKERPGETGVTLERRRTVDIQKTLRIEAPVDQVYAFWRDYRNFPLFLSKVRQVEDLFRERVVQQDQRFGVAERGCAW